MRKTNPALLSLLFLLTACQGTESEKPTVAQEELSLLDGERNVIDGGQRAETLRHMVKDQEFVGHRQGTQTCVDCCS